jgi:coenzyme F420 biosynthesis associated uncharacterized protein
MDAMTLAAERLVDWRTAAAVGARVAGSGPQLSPVQRARVSEDFAELVPQAETMVSRFTLLDPGSTQARAWAMTRDEWLKANLRAFERVLEPFARKILADRRDGPMAQVRRQTLGAQFGALLGYLGHKVLGQYDLFAPPDDEGVLYFVGPNIVGVERKFGFPERDFRLWISLHEVAHRVQFGGVPWLRGHMSALVDSYLGSVDVDPKRLMESLKRGVEEVRRGDAEWRGWGWIFLLMNPEQRDMFKRMQAVMTLLEGHGNFVMDAVARDRMPAAATFKRKLHERRNRSGLEKVFQKAIGFDTKVRQYDTGERFVAQVVGRVGMAGFNRVWDRPSNLPTVEEIARPEAWVARVAAAS